MLTPFSPLARLPEENPLIAQDHQAELRLVSRLLWWSPWIGIVFAGAITGIGPYLVSLAALPQVPNWNQLLSFRFLVLAICPIIVLLTWRWVLVRAMPQKRILENKTPDGAVFALAGLVLAGWVFCFPGVQWYFLEAVKVRAESFSLERSVAYWKGDLAEISAGQNTEAVALLGSSQLNLAVDEEAMAHFLPARPIIKNTLPGFGILQYLMIVPALQAQNAAVVICLLSEFDVYRDDLIPAERLRYFGDWAGKLTLISLLPPRLAWQNRNALADLTMAGLSPFWRDRDLFRVLWASTWWKAPVPDSAKLTPALADDGIEAHAAALAGSIGQKNLVEVNFAAFEAFATKLDEKGIDLVVFEGMTNPQVSAVYDPGGQFHARTRDNLSAMANRAGFTYVPGSEMPRFQSNDFADAVHLNADAREQFTEYLARKLCPNGCGEAAGKTGSHDG